MNQQLIQYRYEWNSSGSPFYSPRLNSMLSPLFHSVQHFIGIQHQAVAPADAVTFFLILINFFETSFVPVL